MMESTQGGLGHAPASPADTFELATRFGAFNARPHDVLRFVTPLPGFETCREFVLVSSPAMAPFTCLHGLDEPKPSFLVVSPQTIAPEFSLALSAADRERLGSDDAEPSALLWLAIVRLDGEQAYANLRAPIVVDTTRMTALQIVDSDNGYDVDVPLVAD